RERQRPVGRSQRRRGAARARRAPDRRAVPVQLEGGRADPEGGVSMADTLEGLRATLPEAARDVKVNLQSVLADGTLSAAQRWGVAVASAIAARNPALRDAVVEAAGGEVPPAVLGAVIDDAVAAASLMAMNNVYYRFRHMVGKAEYGEKPA